MQRLAAHDWPGNVRELFHVIERAAVLTGGEVIDTANLPDAIRAAPVAASSNALPVTSSAAPADLAFRPSVARLERSLIVQALEQAKGNRSAAARLLGIGRPLLYAKLEEHGIAGRAADATEPRDATPQVGPAPDGSETD
jgi:DNA-binding NtrC family response regulator